MFCGLKVHVCDSAYYHIILGSFQFKLHVHVIYNFQKYNSRTLLWNRTACNYSFYLFMLSTFVLKLTVLWCIRLQLLYAASKIGFGEARLLRVLLIPSDLPNGLRIYLKIKENNTEILTKKLDIPVYGIGNICGVNQFKHILHSFWVSTWFASDFIDWYSCSLMLPLAGGKYAIDV